MTDGIIQKVFDKYFIKQNYEYRISITDHNNDLSILKQELITEIKNQSITWTASMVRKEIELFTKELIGDNQE